MRSTLFLTLFAALFSSAMAAFSQGTLNFTRDAPIRWSPSWYKNTEAFCREFRTECVDIVGAAGGHHQLDCVFSQPGPSIRAFCGSTPKDKNGNYVNGVNIKDMTTQAVGGLGGKAKMLGKPLGKKACLKFKVKHPAVIC